MKNNLILTNLKILAFMTLYLLTIFGMLGAAPVSASTWQDGNWTQDNYQTTGSWTKDNHRYQKVSGFKRKFKMKKRRGIKRYSLKEKYLRSHRPKRVYKHYGHKRNYSHWINRLMDKQINQRFPFLSSSRHA